MIEVNNVTKKFGDFVALDDLNMRVPRGAIYGLVGPNGAGKSTIIRHLCGVYKQDSGQVLIDGQTVYENESLKQLVEKMNSKTGFIKAMHCGCEECEKALKDETGITSRCIPEVQDKMPDVCAICGKPAKYQVIWGKAY